MLGLGLGLMGLSPHTYACNAGLSGGWFSVLRVRVRVSVRVSVRVRRATIEQ